MAVLADLTRDLTADEVAALSHYGADSTYLHAVFQGRSADFRHDPQFGEFSNKCLGLVTTLDSAIAASQLRGPAVLHAAHGNGFGVRGSLVGDPASFVGLTYQYPGFISTTAESDFRDRFLAPRRNKKSRPIFLEFRLPAGFEAVDMRHGNHAGEFEFLLARDVAFRIMGAEIVDTDVLSLVLQPQIRSS